MPHDTSPTSPIEPDDALELPADEPFPKSPFPPDQEPNEKWFGEPTMWTQVIEPSMGWMGKETPPAALTELCQMYRKPIIRCIRLWPLFKGEAEDLAHDFISKFIITGLNIRRPGTQLSVEEQMASVRVVQSFRSWLKGCLFNFLCKELRRRNTLKRGGVLPHVALDELEADDEAVVAGAHHESAIFEARFDEEYALGIVEASVEELEKAICSPVGGLNTTTQENQARRFKLLKPYLLGKPNYQLLCEQLGTSYDTAKTAVSRLKAELKEFYTRKIELTVQHAQDVELERQCLSDALRRGLERRRAA